MIRPIDIRLNAAHPELPLVEAFTFTGSPSTVLIRGVPPNCGRWAITSVNVAATFPDNSTTTRAAIQSANGVWVATLPATATSGRTASGLRIMADGIDENGEIVTGYILGVADFAVASLGISPEPGETSYQMLYFDTIPSVLHKGDVTKIDGVLKFYNGTAWEPFANLSNYVPTSRTINGKALTDNVSLSGSDIPTTAAPNSPTLANSISTLTNTTQTLSDSIQTLNDTKANKSDATLTPIYSQTPTFSEWTYSGVPDGWIVETPPRLATDPEILQSYNWMMIFFDGNVTHTLYSTSAVDSSEVVFENNGDSVITATRTRTDILGYTLGSQTDKPLASEAEAEALRQGKLSLAGGTMTGTLVARDFLSGLCTFNIGGEPVVSGRFSIPNATEEHYATFAYKDGKFGLFIKNGASDAGAFYALQTTPGTLALLQNLAGNFDATRTAHTKYVQNELTVYNNALYRCTNANGHYGAWVAADFAVATVEDILAALRAAVASKANAADLAAVATSGSYNDLSNKPTIPAPYSLPIASANTLGGIKVGQNLSIDENGVLSASGGEGGGLQPNLVTFVIKPDGLRQGDQGFKVDGITYLVSMFYDIYGNEVPIVFTLSNVSSFEVLWAGYQNESGNVYVNGQSIGKPTTPVTVTGNNTYVTCQFSACLSPDTLITMADGTVKRLDEVEVGDMVCSIDPETGELSGDRVTEVSHGVGNHRDIWTFEDGHTVTTVGRHRFWNADLGEFMYLEAWNDGESARNADGKRVKLTNRVHEEGKFPHATLFTERWNNYFAGGLLAGNRRSTKGRM